MGLLLRPRRRLLRLVTDAAKEGSSQQTAAAYTTTQAAAPPQRDMMVELVRLSRLHESGALTDQEFTAAKARALGVTTATERQACR